MHRSPIIKPLITNNPNNNNIINHNHPRINSLQRQEKRVPTAPLKSRTKNNTNAATTVLAINQVGGGIGKERLSALADKKIKQHPYNQYKETGNNNKQKSKIEMISLPRPQKYSKYDVYPKIQNQQQSTFIPTSSYIANQQKRPQTSKVQRRKHLKKQESESQYHEQEPEDLFIFNNTKNKLNEQPFVVIPSSSIPKKGPTTRIIFSAQHNKRPKIVKPQQLIDDPILTSSINTHNLNNINNNVIIIKNNNNSNLIKKSNSSQIQGNNSQSNGFQTKIGNDFLSLFAAKGTQK